LAHSPGSRVLLRARGLAGAGVEVSPPVLLLESGRILALGQEALERGRGAACRDLGDSWLCPAPLDAHVHLCLGGDAAGNLAAWARAGVAAVRDLGHPPARDLELPPPGRDLPLVVRSGPGLTRRGPGASWLAQAADTRRDLERLVDERLRAGVGAIKLFASGLLDFERPGRVLHPLVLDQADMAAVVARARGSGRPVVVHASGVEAVGAALAAGVDTIEHGFFLDRDTLAQMADRGVSWSPTLVAVEAHRDDAQGRHDPRIRRNLAHIARDQAEKIRLGHRLGVRLVLGSDSGSYGLAHGRGLFLEMRAWLQAGIDPHTVFLAATRRAARVMGLSGQVGELRPGARDRIMACPHDPRQTGKLEREPLWGARVGELFSRQGD